MHCKHALIASALLGLSHAGTMAGYGIPGDNGFPNPDPDQQKAIGKLAGGLLPNGPLPTKLGPHSTVALQLITANELFETAFFSTLLSNITNGVDGYAFTKADPTVTLQSVLAQEQIHAFGATTILKAVNAFAPGACLYQFPVDNIDDAIALSETFTAVVLGALQGANKAFATDGDIFPIGLISSVIGQEGEQNGEYRILQGERAAESPFLTYVPAPLAWSALQSFTVPGSCPYDLSEIDIPILPGLMTNGGAVATIAAQDQTLTFTADLSSSDAAKPYIGGNGEGLYLIYQTGQLNPIPVALCNVSWKGSVISFEANFPFEEWVMEGFSHATLTVGYNFASADDAVASGLAGPAIIQVKESY